MMLQDAQSIAPLLRSPSPARPLNVLFVTDHLGHANGVIHGASRYYLQVLPRFDRTRVNVHLCILRGRHPFAADLERAGVHPIFLNRSKWDPRALSDLHTLARTTRVEVLHCLAMKGCLFGRMVGRKLGIPAVIHLHDTNDPGPIIGPLQRRIAPWTAAALAVSGRVARYAHETLGVAPERIQVLHNGLDTEAFAHPRPGARERVRRELRIRPGAQVVLLAGRVVPGKGQRELIGCMPRILEACPSAVLLIAGDGPDLAACREAAETAQVSHAVRFAGQRSDMPDVLAAADVGTMPSLTDEGFGYTALEASAAGKPVVAFDNGAIREIVEHGVTGLIIPRGDLDHLASRIASLLLNPKRRALMGQRAAAHAKRFGIDAHVARLQALYASLAATPIAEGMVA